jgi:histone-arginine methyltransferase CARM1
LYDEAKAEMFGQPVVGHFDPRQLITTPTTPTYHVDFATVTVDALKDLTMPFEFTSSYTGLMHGVAGWFDLQFGPPHNERHDTAVELSTGPADERTHWQQVRFLFKEPLAVNATQTIYGWMRCVVNDMRSYTIYCHVTLDPLRLPDPATAVLDGAFEATPHDPVVRRGRWELHEQTYNYNYNPELVQPGGHQPEYACLYQPGMQDFIEEVYEDIV